MTDQKHTPGPWRIRKDGGVETVDGRMVPHSSAWREDAWQGDWATDESQANDALIASAPTLRSDLARLTAERDAAVARAELAEAKERVARASLADITAMGTVAIHQRDALLAEVEAMRGVVEAARRMDGPGIYRALDALDALRARKVGG